MDGELKLIGTAELRLALATTDPQLEKVFGTIPLSVTQIGSGRVGGRSRRGCWTRKRADNTPMQRVQVQPWGIAR